MNGTRCILATAKMDYYYWSYAMRDIVFKQSLLVHQTTERFPYVEWHGELIVLPKAPVFGKIGYAPKLLAGDKLTDRGIVCRYMDMFDLKNILVQGQDGSKYGIRLSYFHAVDMTTYPAQRHHMEFAGYSDRVSTVPQNADPAPSHSSICGMQTTIRMPRSEWLRMKTHWKIWTGRMSSTGVEKYRWEQSCSR